MGAFAFGIFEVIFFVCLRAGAADRGGRAKVQKIRPHALVIIFARLNDEPQSVFITFSMLPSALYRGLQLE